MMRLMDIHYVEKMDQVLAEVRKERQLQFDKWGHNDCSREHWLTILGEEVGEVNRAAVEAWLAGPEAPLSLKQAKKQYRAELIQVAAVAVAMIEAFDRAEEKNFHRP